MPKFVVRPNILGGVFDADKIQLRWQEIEELSEDPTLWNNPEQAKKLQQEQKSLNLILQPLKEVEQNCDDLDTLCSLFEEEFFEDFAQEFEDLELECQKVLKKLEFTSMFTNEFDTGNAYIEIQSGSGGTEAQDWAQMLWRMYRRWIERQEFKIEILDYAEGEVAGVAV